jgi:hypothetical protein
VNFKGWSIAGLLIALSVNGASMHSYASRNKNDAQNLTELGKILNERSTSEHQPLCETQKWLNLKITDMSREGWTAVNAAKENSFAIAYFDNCIGLSQRAIRKQMGRPSYSAGSSLCYPISNKETNDLYFFGGVPQLVRFHFVNSICTKVEVKSFDEDALFRRWLIPQFRKFVVGKTQPEIREYAGESDANPGIHDILLMKKEMNGEHFSMWQDADAVLGYSFGASAPVGPYLQELVCLRDGRCIFVEETERIIANSSLHPSSRFAIRAKFKYPPDNI